MERGRRRTASAMIHSGGNGPDECMQHFDLIARHVCTVVASKRLKESVLGASGKSRVANGEPNAANTNWLWLI